VIVDATLAYAHQDWIRTQADAIRERLGEAHLLLIVDSLHTWRDPLAGEEYDRLNRGIAILRVLSADLRCPVLYIAEQNREASKKGGKNAESGVNAGAGSRRIEYGAETVVGLRVTGGQCDYLGNREVTLTLHKNRSGAAGKPIKLQFNGPLQKFTESDT
jgi:replicative DNA helicase